MMMKSRTLNNGQNYKDSTKVRHYDIITRRYVLLVHFEYTKYDKIDVLGAVICRVEIFQSQTSQSQKPTPLSRKILVLI